MDGFPRFRKNPFPKLKKRPGGIQTKVHQNTQEHGKGLPIPYKMERLAGKLQYIRTRKTSKKRSVNPLRLSKISQAHKIE